MVATERGNNSCIIGKNNLVSGCGREEALKEGNGRVENNGTLNTGLDANLHFVVIGQIGTNALDIRGRRAIEVDRTDEGAKAIGLDLRRIIQQTGARVIKPISMQTSPRAVVSALEAA